jgi:hypothetical protein
MRWTWVVVGGVATLLVFAGLDALRASDSESGSTPSTTTTALGDVGGTTQEKTFRGDGYSFTYPGSG